MVKLKWQVAFHHDHSSSAMARYYDLLGQYLKEQVNLAKLRNERATAERLRERKAIARLELDRLRHDTMAQEERVSNLQASLEEFRKHAQLTDTLLTSYGSLNDNLMKDGQDQLKPLHAKIVALQGERALGEHASAGTIAGACERAGRQDPSLRR